MKHMFINYRYKYISVCLICSNYAGEANINTSDVIRLPR